MSDDLERRSSSSPPPDAGVSRESAAEEPTLGGDKPVPPWADSTPVAPSPPGAETPPTQPSPPLEPSPPPPPSLPPTPLPSQQPPLTAPRRSGAPLVVLIVLALMACGLLAAALAVGAALTGLSRFERGVSLPMDTGVREVETRTFETGATPRLVVRNQNGGTEVRVGEGTSIRVEATKKATGPNPEQKLAGIQLDMNQSGETVRLSYEYNGPRSLLSQGGAAVDFAVTVPRGTLIDVDADNGAITVDGVAAAVNARSDNGAITIRNVEAPIVVSTNNGRITLNRTRGRLEAQTNNGALEATEAQADNLRLESSNGAVTFDGSLSEGTHTIRSNNGRVAVTLPADQRLRVDIQTDNGRIDSRLSLSEARVEPRRVTGVLNGGGPTLTIRTGNGGVTIATR